MLGVPGFSAEMDRERTEPGPPTGARRKPTADRPLKVDSRSVHSRRMGGPVSVRENQCREPSLVARPPRIPEPSLEGRLGSTRLNGAWSALSDESTALPHRSSVATKKRRSSGRSPNTGAHHGDAALAEPASGCSPCGPRFPGVTLPPQNSRAGIRPGLWNRGSRLGGLEALPSLVRSTPSIGSKSHDGRSRARPGPFLIAAASTGAPETYPQLAVPQRLRTRQPQPKRRRRSCWPAHSKTLRRLTRSPATSCFLPGPSRALRRCIRGRARTSVACRRARESPRIS